jgi:predicted HicB family RNase H-like nuclease
MTTKSEDRFHAKEIKLRVERPHHTLFIKAAKNAGLNLSAWIRARLLDAARRETNGGGR